jgi:quercetin dioxygenase-like cupin family protein
MANAQKTTIDDPLPDPSRHITDTNPDTKSGFAKISAPLQSVRNLEGALFRLGYVTRGPSPVPLSSNIDISAYEESLSEPPQLVPPGGGTVVGYIDTPPGSGSPLHRTVSLDFVILVEGEIELHLEDGEVRALKPGDFVVQRATMHSWRNPKWARMIGVMSESQLAVVGVETLTT